MYRCYEIGLIKITLMIVYYKSKMLMMYCATKNASVGWKRLGETN